jgi:translation initiation factor IF-1
MVRNLKGGTGTKGLARKHQTSGDKAGAGGHLRLPTCNDEQFACVSKMLGNGMCQIITNNNISLIGHIRNKFRGRQKRHNTITASMIVLVGLRSWETSPKNCDILCIYDDNFFQQILAFPNFNLQFLQSVLHNLNHNDKQYHNLQNNLQNNLHNDVVFNNDDNNNNNNNDLLPTFRHNHTYDHNLSTLANQIDFNDI